MIVVSDVYYAYQGGVEALRGVSLTLREGEVVALMGENGAGKTTLLKHLNGLLKPLRGSVTVDGIDTRRSTVAQLSRRVGIVFQSPESMFFSSSVWDEVAFALRNLGLPEREVEERVEWALSFMGLKKYSERSPFTLSGGEKKRLSIAIVLAWEPRYLVIDEPTVGQDALSKKLLSDAVGRLRDEGRSVVISTHDVEFVADLRPRVVLMSGGRIVAEGRAEDVLTDEAALLSCSLLMPQVPTILKSLSDMGVRHRLLGVEEAVGEILRALGRRAA